MAGTVCQLWTGSLRKDGYGRIGHKGTYAHRHIWEEVNGPIPDGFDLHHKCGIKRCVNLEHLELLTRMEHVDKHKKAYCLRGHPYDKVVSDSYLRHKGNGNSILYRYKRSVCLTCKRLLAKRSK